VFEERVNRGREERNGELPGEKKRLIQTIEDIDDEVVVGNRMNIRTWELSVD